MVLECQRNACFLKEIILDRHGKKVAGRPLRLQERLGNYENAKATSGVLDHRWEG